MPEPRQPQDRRPSAKKKVTAKASERRDREASEALASGVAISDDDGTRMEVRLGDVKGGHEAQLIKECGLDFQGLLGALGQSQSAYHLGILLWFARLVNGRSGPSFAETIDEVGYGDYLSRDVGEPEPGDARPKASASNSASTDD